MLFPIVVDINQPGLRLSQPAQWAIHTSISDDVGSIDVDTDLNDPFIVEERRVRRKRLRKSRSKQDCNAADSPLPLWPSVQQVITVNSIIPATKTNVIEVGTSQPPVNNKKAVNKPLLIGNKISPGNNDHHPRAAKSWTNFTEKAVYCIDNVCVDTSAEELTQFVSEIAIKVIS